MSQSTAPAWYLQALRGLIESSQNIASQGYVPYTEPRIAGLTPDQEAAFAGVRGVAGRYQPTLDQGIGFVNQSGAAFDPRSIETYMNPYINEILGRVQTLGNRNLQENILPGVNSTFTGAGQFGSSRHADFTSRAIRDTGENIAQQQGAALAGARESATQAALNAYAGTTQNQRQAGTGLASLAGQGQQLGLGSAAAQEAVGRTIQGQGQQNLDLAYSDFLRQQGYPLEQAGFLSNILRGNSQAVSGQSTTTTQPVNPTLGPSPLGQIGGLATAAAGAGKLFGLFKHGGPVKRYSKGGRVGIAAL